MSGDHLDLHVLTHSFPPRRSSDLARRLSRDSKRSPMIDSAASAIPAATTPKIDHLANSSAPKLPGHHQADASNHTVAAVTPPAAPSQVLPGRSEEHTSELQSLMRISYAVFCLQKKKIEKPN